MFFTDMGSLVLDVLTKPDHLPIARVQIPGIAKLSLSHSINGSFTLVSPVSEKLGELQVGNISDPISDDLYYLCYFAKSMWTVTITSINVCCTSHSKTTDQKSFFLVVVIIRSTLLGKLSIRFWNMSVVNLCL